MRHSGNRYLLWPDVVRLVAILLVLAEHSIPYARLESGWVWSEILTCGNAYIFLLLSGTLLLPVAEGDTTAFYCRRLRRVVAPFALWSLIYALTSKWLVGSDDLQFERQLLWSWLAPYNASMWFMFVLIGLYLFAPFISPWLRTATRQSMLLFLGLWVFTLLLPYLDLLAFIDSHTFDSLHSTWVGPFVGPLGYMVTGVYLTRWPVGGWSRCVRMCFWLCIVVCALVLPWLAWYHDFELPDNRAIPFRYDTITTASVAVAWYVLLSRVRRLPRWLTRVVHRGAALSFGVYLCHTFFNMLFAKYMPSWVETTWTGFVLDAACSFTFAWMVSRIPCLRRALG